MNVHKRCQKNVANNCGINTKQMAEILSGMGISTASLNVRKKKPSICESGGGQSVISRAPAGGKLGVPGEEMTEEIRLRLEAQLVMEERERERIGKEGRGEGVLLLGDFDF